MKVFFIGKKRLAINKMTTKLETITINKTISQRESEVVLFDCNCHMFGDVVSLIMKAIKCNTETAVLYTGITQQFGQVAVYKGSKEDCENVASILSSTGLDVSVVD